MNAPERLERPGASAHPEHAPTEFAANVFILSCYYDIFSPPIFSPEFATTWQGSSTTCHGPSEVP